MTVEPYLALLAWKTKRPVRMVWTRQESLLARQKRHPFTMRYRTGATQRRADHRPGDLDRGQRRRLPAAQHARAVRRRGERHRARTGSTPRASTASPCSRTPCRPARSAGSGRCRSCSRYEQQMDRLAEALGMDPRGAARAQLRLPGRPPRRPARRSTPAWASPTACARVVDALGDAVAGRAGQARRPRLRLQHAALRALGVLRRPRLVLDGARAGRHARHPRRRDGPRRGPGRLAVADRLRDARHDDRPGDRSTSPTAT